MEFVEEKCQERWGELLEAGETLALWDGAFVSRAKWLGGLGAKGGRPAWPSQAAARRGGQWRAKPHRQSTRECWVCSPETRIAVTSLSCACESVPGLPDQRHTNRLVPGNKSDSLAVLEAHSAKSRCASPWLPAGSSSLGVRGLAAASFQSVSGITRPTRVCVAQGSLRSVRVRLRDSVLFITTPLTSGEGPLRQRRVTLACLFTRPQRLVPIFK